MGDGNPMCYDSPMHIGKRLAELRTERGWSQKDLSSKIGVHYTSIGRWERDESQPDLDDIAKIAEAFGVSADYLIFENAPRSGKINIHDLELLKQFEELAELTPEDLSSVKKLIDGFLLRARMAKKFSKENTGHA